MWPFGGKQHPNVEFKVIQKLIYTYSMQMRVHQRLRDI